VVAIGLLCEASGAFFLAAAIFNWNWFFNMPKLRHGLLGALDRSAQRVLYGIVGTLFMVLGILLITGLVLL
jgi:hypothetical protein